MLIDNAADLFGEIVATNHKDEFHVVFVDKLLDACERKLGLKFCDQHTVLIDNAADLFGEIVATNHKDEFHVVFVDKPALRTRLKALGIAHVHYGTEDKRPAAEQTLQALGLDWSQAAVIGDDWPALRTRLKALGIAHVHYGTEDKRPAAEQTLQAL
ncbi:hypothetical protein [Mycobacterium tuberculosis]|uniref:hypothetical protein n=1 Tax=Mycobacterium tuberculosis TaxID=1773 RepID=UPI002729A7FA|nr:hypothetical protein [Mycobacterium tuberculosis]